MKDIHHHQREASTIPGVVRALRPWLENFPVSAGFTESPEPAASPDLELGERIVAAYRRAKDEERCRGVQRSDMWSGFLTSHLRPLAELLEDGAPAPLLAHLRRLPREPTGNGFFQGQGMFHLMAADPVLRENRARWMVDALCSLAEAVGVLPTSCPEQSGWNRAPIASVEALTASIERALGVEITVPAAFEGLMGISVDGRIVHVRSVWGALAAWRCKQWLGRAEGKDMSEARLAEIGPGVGLAAIIAIRLGVRDLSLFDLPILNVVQAYFLTHACADCPLELFGEEPADGDGPALRVLPDFAFAEQPTDRFDLGLNQDSFPEMDRRIALGYLHQCRRSASYLLSINQEMEAPQTERSPQLVVAQLAAEIPGCEQLYRVPFWARRGYVEELYRFTAGPRAAREP